MTPRTHFRTALLAAALLVSGLAHAADDRRVAEIEEQVRALEASLAAVRGGATGADATRLAELERQIEVLTKEIEAMRLGDAAATAAEPEGRYGLAPAASKVYGLRRGVSIGGYGEIVYQNFSGRREDGQPSGLTDQLDLQRAIVYFGYKFDDRFVFNSEIEWEHATTGEGAEEKGEVSVEFAHLDVLFSDPVNLRAGLVLIPLGFVNELHEGPVFLGARRPLVEQRIIPTTWREIGVGVFGEAGPVVYRAYVVNGLAAIEGAPSEAEGYTASGIRGGRQSGSRAAAEDLALTARVDVKPVKGLLVGGSVFTGNAGQGATEPGGDTIDARTTIFDLHAEYRGRGVQARALWARTSVDDVALINAAQGLAGAASVGERQYGWYGEVGYDILAPFESRQSVVPFARYERLNTQDRVPAGFAVNPANDMTITTLGVVWKPILNIAVKADWNKVENDAETGVDQVNLALAWLF